MKKVSLYIPCYNAEKYIWECLESVFIQTYPIDEILIIDDGSTDNTVNICSQYPVKIISHERNKGLSVARNTAIRSVRNEFVASLDADCKAKPDWLEKLMLCFEDNNLTGAGGKLIEKYMNNLADKWRAVHMCQHWGGKIAFNPYFLAGNNTVYKTSALFSIGLYNEKYINYNEDTDMTRRLIKDGLKLMYTPFACVEHLRRDTIETVLFTFWHYVFYNYNPPKSLKDILCKLISNLKLCKTLLIEDARYKRLPLLIIDFMLVFHHLWLDWKYYRKDLTFKSNRSNIG